MSHEECPASFGAGAKQTRWQRSASKKAGSRFMSDESILVINTGSSSLKIGLYGPQDGDEGLLLDGLASGIGQSTATLELKDAQGRVLRSETLGHGSEGDALDRAAQ